MNEFVERLKQRKLIQWALAYLAGAFALYTGLQAIGEPWGVTDTALRMAQGILGVGFPIALTLAWYHGEKGRQRVSGPELLIIAGLLLASGLLGRLLIGGPMTAEVNDPPGQGAPGLPAPVAPSIAVLPFESRGGEGLDASLVAGLHDGVLSQLGKIPSLESRSRTSVMALADSSLTTRDIARELNVDYIVEGLVQREGDDVQVRVGLIDADTDARVWNETLRGDLTVAGLLEIQEEIALRVASGVGAEVSPAVRQRLNVEAPENYVAYEHYLEGLRHLGFVEGVGARPEPGPVHAQRGIDAFEAAIELEPNWAPPRFGAGRIHHFMASSGYDPEPNFARSKELLDSALEIDSVYGPAWGSLAYVRFRWERDFAGALEAYERAVALGVDSGWGRGLLFATLGRWDDAVNAYASAAEENPLSRSIQLQFGFALFCSGRYDEAVEQMELVREMRGSEAYEMLALSYVKAGRRAEALALAAMLTETGAGAWNNAYLFAALDSATTARRYLEQALQLEPEFGRVRMIAPAIAILDGRDAVLSYLEDTAIDFPESLDWVDCSEEIRQLRGDDRYIALMNELGFPGRGAAR